MKKLTLLLAAVLTILAAPAHAASITLSTGASCVFKGVAFDAGGSASVQCVDIAVVVPVPPPVITTPPVVTTPATVNPFIAWKAEGWDLVQIAIWKLGRGLTPEEVALAKAAGYDAPPNPATRPEGGGITPPAVPAGGGLWVPGKSRLSTGDLQPGSSVESTFTIPEGWSGIVEVGISGQNLQVYIDGQIYGSPRYDMKPGLHWLKVQAAALANGSIDLYHFPQ